MLVNTVMWLSESWSESDWNVWVRCGAKQFNRHNDNQRGKRERGKKALCGRLEFFFFFFESSHIYLSKCTKAGVSNEKRRSCW